MKKLFLFKKKTVFFTMIILTLLSACISCSRANAAQYKTMPTKHIVSNENNKRIEIDLTSAYKMAAREAKKWNPNSKLYWATSTDTVDSKDVNQGKDGNRQFWTFIFVIENPDTCFNVYVFNGKIAHTQINISAFNEELLLPIEKLKITSKEAVEIATSKCGLLPGENWAVGYHFTLRNIDNELIIAVIGLNVNNEITRIYINTSTKEIMN